MPKIPDSVWRKYGFQIFNTPYYKENMVKRLFYGRIPRHPEMLGLYLESESLSVYPYGSDPENDDIPASAVLFTIETENETQILQLHTIPQNTELEAKIIDYYKSNEKKVIVYCSKKERKQMLKEQGFKFVEDVNDEIQKYVFDH